VLINSSLDRSNHSSFANNIEYLKLSCVQTMCDIICLDLDDLAYFAYTTLPLLQQLSS
jgi:hypothetical protein